MGIFTSGINRQHIPHGIRRLFLSCCGDMGVGVQRKACAVVAKHAGYGFYIHAVLEDKGRESVPQVVQTNGAQLILFQKPFPLLSYGVVTVGVSIFLAYAVSIIMEWRSKFSPVFEILNVFPAFCGEFSTFTCGLLIS